MATKMPAVVTIGVDVGTTGLKAVVLDSSARLLRQWAVRYPTRLAGLGAEQDGSAWWDAAREALRAVADPDERVAAIAVTSQGPTLVALDRDGEPTGPALTWIDRRSYAEAAELGELLGPGRNRADPYFATSKLLWWQRRGALLRAHTVLCANSFIAHRLSGVASSEESTAGFFTGWEDGFDARLERAGVPVHLLPPAVRCDEVIGQVTPDASWATGVPAGTPVVAGAIDAVGAALEAGLLHPGDGVAEMTGFSTVSLQPVRRGTTVPGMIHTRHCVPGTDLLLTAQVSTGAVVDWVCRLTGRASVEELDAETPERRPGRLLLLPSFAGERTPTWDTGARGALVGLDLDTTPGDLLLAVYEGAALALRADLEAVAAAVSYDGPLLLCGGGARSLHWPRIKADVLGREVRIPVSGHGAAYGAALLAGLGAGVWSDADGTRAGSRETARTFAPDPARHAAYTRLLAEAIRVRDGLPATTAVLTAHLLADPKPTDPKPTDPQLADPQLADPQLAVRRSDK
ncbi:FGGY-family carbohydrate kinase [Streptomyces sp. NPDC052236]|uniref:FGGY-family carbohydrate kinase n=1 Tax=Streptomyces sp. NPDC052236 TaxID=3365686 RepID=UPI0037D03BB5